MIGSLLTIATASFAGFLLSRALSRPTYNQLEEQKKEAENARRLFEAFMENSPALGLMKDADGRYVYVNAALEKAFGITRAEIVGREKLNANDIDDTREILAHDRKVIETGEKLEAVEHYMLPDGTVQEWLIVKFPIYGGGRVFVGGVGMNVSAHRAVEDVRARLAAIVASSQDAIISTTLDGTIDSWNHAAENLYGYTAEEVIGKPILIVVPPEQHDAARETLAQVGKGMVLQQQDGEVLAKSGERIPAIVTGWPIKNAAGQIVGAAAIFHDCRQKKAQEQEINELNTELKARVYELAEANATIQAARDNALEASSLKSAFVANISHELRTPLSGILGMTELLLAQPELSDETRDMVNTVLASANALLSVVNDILDLSKIEAGKVTLEYEPFNPGFLVQDCTRLLAPAAKNKNLELRLTLDQHLPHFVFGDASRVRQVLLNLIGNAVKFTDLGYVAVEAKVRSESPEQASILFQVSDTGIGISEDEKRYLFKPFVQVDHTFTRRFGGTGLGLSISKHFVEMMSGQIGLYSVKGSGSTFWFEVPFAIKSISEIPEGVKKRKPVVEPLPAEIAIGKKVLIVEDNPALRLLALRQVNVLGIEADAVEFGRAAVDSFAKGHYDIILMDVNLPDISGYVATEEIRVIERENNLKHTPILAMTAGAMRGDRKKALDAGMDDYLAKPVSIEHLRGAINKWLLRSAKKSTDSRTSKQ